MAFYTPAVVAKTGTHIRAELNGKTVAESDDVVLFREAPFRTHYAFREEDIDKGVVRLNAGKAAERKPTGFGNMEKLSLYSDGSTVDDAAARYRDVPDTARDLEGRIVLEFGAMDRWFEEDEELLGHPRDPYIRIDVRHSRRHLQVAVGGKLVADSTRPMLLLETGLPVRYYVPRYFSK